ncbi:MAG: Maf-like protein [Pirellulales bacterium]|nr:Maf-like protein [Pirellulales bacterium]
MPSPVPPSPPVRIILASNSSRRRELLSDAGYEFTVVPSDEDVEKGVCSECSPADLVAKLALRKALAVFEKLKNAGPTALQNITLGKDDPPRVIVAADTVAECDGLILGKPRDMDDARAMLSRLRGRDHRVLTGLCLVPLDAPNLRPRLAQRPTPILQVAVSKLHMDQLSDAQIEEYLDSGQWEGKAGAFGYQDRLGWVHVEEGSESNVVGLPMELLAQVLGQHFSPRSP